MTNNQIVIRVPVEYQTFTLTEAERFAVESMCRGDLYVDAIKFLRMAYGYDLRTSKAIVDTVSPRPGVLTANL